MSTPDEIRTLLAELTAEFGGTPKPKKIKYTDPNAAVKSLNRAWHGANPPAERGARSYAKEQLNRGYRNVYDWATHRVLTLAEAEGQSQAASELDWTPEARVTIVIRQHCSVCASRTDYVGNEYIRFHGRRRMWQELGGEARMMSPTWLRPAAECDPNLIMFGLPNGSALPDLVETVVETISRCIGCIEIERQAWKMLEMIIEENPQTDLPGFDQVLKEISK